MLASYHTHRITLIVSHSSYHTRRITLVVSHSSYHTPTLLPVEYDEYWCDKQNTGI